MRIRERRPARGIRKIDEEGFVRFRDAVGHDLHGLRDQGRPARLERERYLRGEIIEILLGRVVGRAEDHRHGLHGGSGQAHLEDGIHQARIAFLNGRVADEDARSIVVDNRAQAEAVQDRGIDGIGQVDEERLVELVDRVAQHVHAQRLGDLAGGEGERAVGGEVILSGRLEPSRRRWRTRR